MPPTPIMREDNWPLLTVSKGFFETLATKGEQQEAARRQGAQSDDGWDTDVWLGGDGMGFAMLSARPASQ